MKFKAFLTFIVLVFIGFIFTMKALDRQAGELEKDFSMFNDYLGDEVIGEVDIYGIYGNTIYLITKNSKEMIEVELKDLDEISPNAFPSLVEKFENGETRILYFNEEKDFGIIFVGGENINMYLLSHGYAK